MSTTDTPADPPALTDEPVSPERVSEPPEPEEPASELPASTGVRRQRRKRSARRNAIEWIVVVAGALLVAFLIKTFLVAAFYIPSQSMEPALRVGDRVLVNKLSYDLHDVGRGDIIVFQRPDNAGPGTTEDLIKRVVALPGESVEAKDGRVYVDGELLDEPYLDDGVQTPNFEFGVDGRVEVGDDEVFVLGDNRGNSSASNVFGPIDQDLIVGRAFIRVWPLGSFGGI